jgi:hypothetical protein
MDKFQDIAVAAPQLLKVLQEHQMDIAGTPISTALITTIIASLVMILFSTVLKRKIALRYSPHPLQFTNYSRFLLLLTND